MKKNYYKSVTVGNVWSNNYIQYKSNNGDEKKTLSSEKHVNKIKPYLNDIINNLKKSDQVSDFNQLILILLKIQSTVTINFISLKDKDEESAMHSKTDNIEIMINDKVDEVIVELFKSLHNSYKNNLEISMKRSEFVFDYVDLLYYKCQEINLNCGGSYIGIKKDPQRIRKINPFINKYNGQFLLMFCILKRKNTVYPAYVSKHNRIREKQVILLMIPNGERWHYLAVKKQSALLRVITST